MITKKLMIIVVTCAFVGLLSGHYIYADMAFPQDPSTYDYFLKICNMPYLVTDGPHPETFWTKGGDCDDRAFVFADYLKSKGATNVYICTAYSLDPNGKIIFKDNEINGHSFIIWNNKVYSPNNDINHRFYDTDIRTYQKFLKKTYGYNVWYGENNTDVYF